MSSSVLPSSNAYRKVPFAMEATIALTDQMNLVAHAIGSTSRFIRTTKLWKKIKMSLSRLVKILEKEFLSQYYFYDHFICDSVETRVQWELGFNGSKMIKISHFLLTHVITWADWKWCPSRWEMLEFTCVKQLITFISPGQAMELI